MPPDQHVTGLMFTNSHTVWDAMLRLYDDLRSSLPTENIENVIKSYMRFNIAPCASLEGLMESIADIDIYCYIRLLKIFATSDILRAYALSQLQHVAWLNEDDPELLVKDCSSGRCKTVESWSLNHADETGYGTGILSVAGDFDIRALCLEILNPCPSPSTGSIKADTRGASLFRLLSRWKNSGRLPEPGDMATHLLSRSPLGNPTPLFEILCRQSPSLAKDPKALAAIAVVRDPLRYDLSTILFEDVDALNEWLVLASINLDSFSKTTDLVLEYWNSDRRRCFDKSFAHFVVPFLGYRKPLSIVQKRTAFVVIQCVAHVVTKHAVGGPTAPMENAVQRSEELEQVLRMRRRFGLPDGTVQSVKMDIDTDLRSTAVETAETWLVDW